MEASAAKKSIDMCLFVVFSLGGGEGVIQSMVFN
jgi:hypothetical protein